MKKHCCVHWRCEAGRNAERIILGTIKLGGLRGYDAGHKSNS